MIIVSPSPPHSLILVTLINDDSHGRVGTDGKHILETDGKKGSAGTREILSIRLLFWPSQLIGPSTV